MQQAHKKLEVIDHQKRQNTKELLSNQYLFTQFSGLELKKKWVS